MLKKIAPLLFILFVSLTSQAQDKWFLQKINDKVSLNFPVEPKKINEKSYGVKDKDGVVFIVSSVDLLQVTGLSLEEFNKNAGTQEFADGFMEGLTPTMPKYTFKPAKVVTYKGNTAYQVTGRDEANKSTVNMNIIFVDGVAHSVTTLLPDGKDNKQAVRFLNELYLNGK